MQSKILQYKMPPDCGNVGEWTSKLNKLMKQVMKRQAVHWTDELKAFYELMEKKDG